MKFSIKKKLKNVDVSFDDKKISPKVIIDGMFVSTGYCSNGTPFINNNTNTKPQAYHRNNLIDFEGYSTKNLLLSIKTTTKMKKKQVKNHNNNAMSVGSATLKSFGVSFGNLFKPSKRIGKNTPQIIIDPSSAVKGIYFPHKVVETSFRSNQPITVIPNQKSAIQLIKHDFIPRTSLTPRTAKLTSVHMLAQSKTVANLNNYESLNSEKPPSMHTRKSQPSMGIEVKALKSRKINMNSNQFSDGDDEVEAKSFSRTKSSIRPPNDQKEHEKTKENIYENISMGKKRINETYVIERLKVSEDDGEKTLMPDFDFEKYLNNANSSPNMSPLSASTSMSSLNQFQLVDSTCQNEHSFLSTTNPTPFIRFNSLNRIKKIRSMKSKESLTDLKKLDKFLDAEFNMDNFTSEC